LFWWDLTLKLTERGETFIQFLDLFNAFYKTAILKKDQLEAISYKTQKRIALLDMLLKSKQDDPTISFDDIQEEIETYLSEDHEKFSSTLSWACHLIGSHPDVKKKLFLEIDSVLGEIEKYVTNDNLKRLEYLERIIKETQRLYPPFLLNVRILTDDIQVG